MSRLTLADLRLLVDKTKHLAATSKVSTKEHKSYNQRDWDAASITVHGNGNTS